MEGLWYCFPCNVWWLSNASFSPERWHLERMLALDITKSGSNEKELSKAPAWNISGPAPLFCPECGKTMRSQPSEEREEINAHHEPA